MSAATDAFGLSADVAVLLRWFAVADALPAREPALVERYGAFGPAADVPGFVRALAEAQLSSHYFGGPAALTALLATVPDALNGTTPPGSLYSALVWVASEAGNAAGAIASALADLPQLAQLPGGAEHVRGALRGKGGLAPDAGRAAAALDDARLRVTAALDPLAAVARVLAGATILSEANRQIGALTTEIELLELRSSPAAAELETARRELARKRAFANDTRGLFSQAPGLERALGQIERRLHRLQTRFADQQERFEQTAALADGAQLADPAWLTAALDIPQAVPAWRQVAADATAFAQGAFVEPASAGDEGRPA